MIDNAPAKYGIGIDLQPYHEETAPFDINS